MANKLNGEVEIAAGDSTFVLRLGVNEYIELQDALAPEATDQEFMGNLQAYLKTMKSLRTLARVALRRQGEEAPLDDAEAGKALTLILGTVGTVRFGQAVAQALAWALPGPRKEQAQPKGKAASSPGRSSR